MLAGLDVPPPSRQRIAHDLNRWDRLAAGADPCPDSFDRFRRTASDAGLSPRTIESTVSDLAYLCRRHDSPVLPGRRLRVPPPQPEVPNAEEVSAVYLHADSATWPPRRPYAAADWWRALLVVAVWTGLRRGDLARLSWRDIGETCITVRAGKTGRLQRFPLTPLITRHLLQLSCRRTGSSGLVFEFPASSSFRACYDQLARLSALAGVRPPLTLQALRRLSICLWSAANAEAGRIVHGCGLGVMRHYLDPLALLRAVGPSVRLPEAFLSPEERETAAVNRVELLARFDAASPLDRGLILGVARVVGRRD